MRNLYLLLISICLIGTVGMANANTITGSGHIYNTPQGGSIENIYFSVITGGYFDINVWDDPSTYGDPEINLFINDGVLSMDDFIENDDDGGPGFDSYIGRSLGVGDYLLRVSGFNFGNISGTDPVIIADFNAGTHQDFYFNYSISSRCGTVVPGSSDLQPVPEPATMVLMGLGLIGLAGVGRKKIRK